MGGKARLRKWLIERFPQRGRCYVEPFCGKANVFFAAYSCLTFERWELSDIDIRFLSAVLSADFDELPDFVERADFDKWKRDPSAISALIEPRITFAGKGYAFGFSGSSGTHVGYTRTAYLPLCREARRLLSSHSVSVRRCSWGDAINGVSLQGRDADDFIYCDPPYLGTSACYADIDHRALIAALNASHCRWAVSGYPNDIYEEYLRYVERHVCVRNSEIKSSNARTRTPVTEILWTNY